MSISSLSAIEENNTSLNVPVMTGDSLVHLSEDSDDDNDLSLNTDITSSFENYFNDCDQYYLTPHGQLAIVLGSSTLIKRCIHLLSS